VKTRELRRRCERGVTRDLYMQACALLWDNNNPTDIPVDQDV
jgi:hypothetical protein